jgi:hypothetical protein
MTFHVEASYNITGQTRTERAREKVSEYAGDQFHNNDLVTTQHISTEPKGS